MKLQVGDTVKIHVVKDKINSLRDGATGKVVNVDSGSPCLYPFRVQFPDGQISLYVESELTKIEKEWGVSDRGVTKEIESTLYVIIDKVDAGVWSEVLQEDGIIEAIKNLLDQGYVEGEIEVNELVPICFSVATKETEIKLYKDC